MLVVRFIASQVCTLIRNCGFLQNKLLISHYGIQINKTEFYILLTKKKLEAVVTFGVCVSVYWIIYNDEPFII